MRTINQACLIKLSLLASATLSCRIRERADYTVHLFNYEWHLKLIFPIGSGSNNIAVQIRRPPSTYRQSYLRV